MPKNTYIYKLPKFAGLCGLTIIADRFKMPQGKINNPEKKIL